MLCPLQEEELLCLLQEVWQYHRVYKSPKRSDQQKTSLKAYQASAKEHNEEGKFNALSSEIRLSQRQIVPNTISTAISSAFSVIGLPGKYKQICPSVNPTWVIDSGASDHMTGAYTGSSYKNYTGNKLVTANGEKLDLIV